MPSSWVFHDPIIYDHLNGQIEVSDNLGVGRLEVALCELGHQKLPLNYVGSTMIPTTYFGGE